MPKPRSIGHDPLSESDILREFYKPSPSKDSSPRPGATSEKAPELVKATFYLASEDIIALEELQLRMRRQNGQRANKSELIREAIQLLVRQHERG